MSFDYDLFVLGAGSGGVRAARLSAQFGARVASAEASRVGGTCVIRGCVPKKLLVYGSEFAGFFSDAAGYGWTVGDVSFDWAALRDRVAAEVTRLEGIYGGIFERNGVTLYKDRAVLRDAHTVHLVDEGRDASSETMRSRCLSCRAARSSRAGATSRSSSRTSWRASAWT